MDKIDWSKWNLFYEDKITTQYHRLIAIKQYIKNILLSEENNTVLNICSGESRDILQTLVELEMLDVPVYSIDTHTNSINNSMLYANEHNLLNYNAICEDASLSDTYIEYNVPRSKLIILSGVFGMLSDIEINRLLKSLPMFIKNDGYVVWTVTYARLDSIKEIMKENNFLISDITITSDNKSAIGVSIFIGDESELLQNQVIFKIRAK